MSASRLHALRTAPTGGPETLIDELSACAGAIVVGDAERRSSGRALADGVRAEDAGDDVAALHAYVRALAWDPANPVAAARLEHVAIAALAQAG